MKWSEVKWSEVNQKVALNRLKIGQRVAYGYSFCGFRRFCCGQNSYGNTAILSLKKWKIQLKVRSAWNRLKFSETIAYGYSLCGFRRFCMRQNSYGNRPIWSLKKSSVLAKKRVVTRIVIANEYYWAKVPLAQSPWGGLGGRSPPKVSTPFLPGRRHLA